MCPPGGGRINVEWSLARDAAGNSAGAQVTVNRMLSFESVKQRLGREQPLSFLEFNYMLLQVWERRPCFFPRGDSYARRAVASVAWRAG